MNPTQTDGFASAGPDLASRPSQRSIAARTRGPALQVIAVALSLATFAHSGFAAAAKPTPDNARVSTTLTPEGGHIVVEAHGTPAPAPLFFSATAEHVIHLGTAEITGEIRLKLHVVQGKPELLTLGLSGDGDVVNVTGAGLRDWAVRSQTTTAGVKRFLDLRPLLADGTPEPRDLDLVVTTRRPKPAVPGTSALLLLAPGDAVGFAAKVSLQPDATVDLRVTNAAGMLPLDEPNARDPRQFYSTTDGRIDAMLTQRGAALGEADLLGAQLTGRVNETTRSAAFRLRGSVRAQKAGARLQLLSGRAALDDKTGGDGWHIELVATAGTVAYELVCDREGVLAVDLTFAGVVVENGDWRGFDFRMPAGAVVPLRLEGLGDDVEFAPSAAVVPTAGAQGWQGFLPADGSTALAWKRRRTSDEGTLFFTSFEQTDVRVGAGLLRQSSQVSFRILQGKLPNVRLHLGGPGEIVGVEGANVVGWSVVPAAEGRVLDVRLSRPFEDQGSLVVRSQAALGGFPVNAEPVRLTPEGGVRHSGFVRVANSGAVRLEVADVEGMMQLAPAQYPGAAIENGARQVFVYRFPSAGYGYRIIASQIQPEINVSEIATYELGETDRVINADLELDVREAPLRDWSLRIPEEYAVVAVQGNDVADYVAETTATEGYRTLKILFGRAIDGRQLLRLRLEKNQPAAAGEWKLPALQFPGAKSVRGHIGAVSAPGYRFVPASSERLVEVPLSYFPKQMTGLQQAFRLREPEWTATLRIEALGQSVQADVFHLYSLKEGVVYGSVLLNYFVVGAPANEWRVEVPESVGNIDVVGQNVRRDWRREGNQVIVSLHQPVLGAATLLITFEQPMSARGGAIHPGEVRALNVQGERGYIQVVSPLQVKHEIRTAEGSLLKLEQLELPAEYRLLSSSPSLAVYQYTARPFTLEMGVEWYEPGEMVDQVVDFAKLASRVSRDGQVATDARFFVKTRGRKALRMTLPEGVKLWEARVDNEVVNARADGDQTLVPLPPRMNPNEPVEVALRLGQAAIGSGTMVQLTAPKMSVPVVINEWTLEGDAERLLVPAGGNADLVTTTLTESGFELISRSGRSAVAKLFGVIALGLLLFRAGLGWKTVLGTLVCAGAAFMALVLALDAYRNQGENLAELTYAATVVPAGDAVSIRVANVIAWHAMISWWGVVAGVAGVGALIVAIVRRAPRAMVGPDLESGPSSQVPAARTRGPALQGALAAFGAALISAGLLAQRGGAFFFFAAVGISMILILLVRGYRHWRGGNEPETPADPNAGVTPIVTALVLLSMLGLTFGGAPNARAEDQSPPPTPWLQEGTKPAQSIVQMWTIHKDRLFAEVDVTVRGGPGDSFLLLNPHAVLTDFKGDGLRVSKVERDGRTAYYVTPERDATLTAHARFEMPVPELAKDLALPTGPAATQRVTIDLDQGGWEFVSPLAVSVTPTPGVAENHSGATLVLAPNGAPMIQLQPQRRNIAAETTQFFAEAANLYVPGPGVVNGITRLTVRPAQGRVSELELEIPVGFTVGDVARGPVGEWRFDPQKRRLHVVIEPAQTEAFRFDVETQLGTAALPVDLTLQPLRIVGAAGEVGMIALAFGGEAQPEGVRAGALSAVNVEDFDAGLLPRNREGQPLAVLQNVWRYGREGGEVALKVAPVAPEIRVATRQVWSLGDDRLVAAIDLNVSITRVGLFKLSFALPEGLEVEALSGAALNHWTEAVENSQRVITLHLNGRTIGDQAFTLSLAGAAPAAQPSWKVPQFSLREATRQTGEILLVPEKGIRLRAVDRENATQLDPRAAGGQQPGTLAFRLLQQDWTLTVGVEALDAWVTAQALQEVTAREGQTLTRIAVRYRVENASVKQLRVRLPGLTEDQVRTVRATGTAVSDFVKVAGEADLWDVHFQRGIAGETDVQIEFQGQAAREQNRETIATPEFVGVRQATHFVAVRGGGRLELEAGDLPRGWQRVDWSAVPVNLQDRSDRSVPTLCFRVADPEGALAVIVRRHEVADALKLRVTQGELTTIFSPSGAFLTAVDLTVDVTEKSTLRVRLPKRARLFNTFVNGAGVSVVREGDEFLFHVTPNSDADRSASVRLVYAVMDAQSGRIALVAPGLSVPLEHVSWHVVLPPGRELDDYAGGLRLEEESDAGAYDVEQYQSLLLSKRSAEKDKATALLEEASTLLKKGEQERAGEALSKASGTLALDAASTEDARVQLRALKTQQAVLGLNTRRQRMYLDNRADALANAQLEQAASANPFMQGKTNFDPTQVDQLLMGNTVDENTALRGIAARIVDQQLAAEPAPGAIDVTLPERGRVFTFTRSLQVDGSAPLELKLALGRTSGVRFGFVSLLVLAVGVLSLIAMPRRTEA